MEDSSVAIIDSRVIERLFGECDKHLKKVRKALGVQVTVHKGRIQVTGEADNVAKATMLFESLREMAHGRDALNEEDVDRAIAEVVQGQAVSKIAPIEAFNGRQVRPRTPGQVRYIEAIRKHGLVLCRGPAGTGKTYLAVAMAVNALREKKIRKIVLVRPAVEAGESLGFLPGDLLAKINPYLRPLYDALNEMMEHDLRQRLMQDDVIEVVPLAYMRGRTLSDAFIILDEAQNTTVGQMKMFLTRMGAGSTIVVCGDTTQIDLPHERTSGLQDAVRRLRNIRGVASIELQRSDIVRHRLVQAIVDAYEDVAGKSGGRGKAPQRGRQEGKPRRDA